MFGMLDYRAHKLLWLMCLPFQVAAKISFFIIVFVSILIVQSTTFSVPIKIGLAYVFTEAIGLVVLGLWSAIFWIIRRTFLWVIDVVPAHGTNAEEAREVVLKGKAVPLAKKFATDIENWTDDNTQAFVSVMNWRARIFFDAKARIRRRVRKLKCFHEETGRQPGELSTVEVKQVLGPPQETWFEKMIVIPAFFNSLIGFTIIAIVIAYGG